MDILENTTRSFSDIAKKLDNTPIANLISTFIGFDEEYKKLLSEAEDLEILKDDNVLLLSKEQTISEIVEHGVRISDTISKLKRELDVLSQNLKIYGASKIREWNKTNGDDVSSIRLPSTEGDRTVLITVKNAYTIDAKKLSSVKKEIGSKFDDVFSTDITWTVKNDKIKDVISIIKNALGKAGAAFVKEAFVETITYKVKSKKAIEDLLNSDIPDNVKQVIKSSIKAQEPAITYPK